MSAPDTNIEKQRKRHKPALLGIGAVVGFAGVLLFALVVWVFGQSDGIEGADRQIDGRTGAVVEN
ncbi:hypothetical protein KUH32_16070 [Thalassococcus sp. CAU 1522]|uniref:Uncharacterized protein n=1 Tax=Thalassococcus arenae TaxID=2851652 RepID=A0ABS6NB86_9RHOB|nr:hypothetical protein [Thalassococcus arenae]MBV2361282.1 hypothetical protein [Thalassococcus arenae]